MGRCFRSCQTGAFIVLQSTLHRLSAVIERRLPEQRLFLKSDSATRFIRLSPVTQAVMFVSVGLLCAWTMIASAILLIDSIGAGDARERVRQTYLDYEQRLDALARERDTRAAEAVAAQQRFTVALEQVSRMQSTLLASEERRRELETGIGLMQTTLRTAMNERDAARGEVAGLSGSTGAPARTADDLNGTLAFLSTALQDTATERDAMADVADSAKADADKIAFDMRLMEERHDEIFAQLQDAVTISMEPLDKVFTSVGIDPQSLLDDIKSGYSGQGGPMGAMMPPLPGDASPAAKADYDRAKAIFDGLDQLNLYRMAVEKTPLALPLRTSFRYTSGFGRRWGRMHEGIDLAGAYGSPIYATADGVVVHAGWQSGYGNMVEIRHPYGLSTRYGHMSAVKVEVGQKVSRGDRIGDMGNTGHSTGTHLHYEVRVDGSAVNPMTFIKAATNVF